MLPDWILFRRFAVVFFLASSFTASQPTPETPASPSTQNHPSPTVAESKPLIDPREPSVLGELQIIPINSKILHNARNLRVWLPANYFAPVNRNKHYPVLYMQDGQNLFDEATAVNHEWKFDETVQFLTGSMRIHPMIVVGVDSANDPHQRAVEYLPYPDSLNPQSPGPDEVRGKEFADFVVKEVMPLVQKKYRVAFGQANTGIGGSSYGGTVSLYIALHYPTLFGKALIESPVLEVGNGKPLRDAEAAKIFPLKTYLAVGTNEGRDAETSSKLVEDVQELEKILRAKGLGPNRLEVVVEEGGEHSETAWSKRLQGALLFLYGSDIHLIPAK
jgi:predicted alpha/beta superfamily hydrolase